MLGVGVALFVSLGILSTSGGPGNCTVDLASIGGCHQVANSGTQIDIVGEQNAPGRDNGGASTGRGSGGGAGASDANGAQPTQPTRADGCTEVPGRTGSFLVCPAEDEEEVAPGIPAVTARDLASFAPARPSLGSEPAGVGVVGMPANFVASASAQTIGGTLFGRAVTVQFTPVGYVFDYGDGSTARSTSGGASWSDLGQPQFTPTPTSHSYAERGTYDVSVTIEYSAAVDFGTGSWFPVRGVVTATTAGHPVEIYEVRTALVDKTCAENPAGPGC
jgi:hypothetical protein